MEFLSFSIVFFFNDVRLQLYAASYIEPFIYQQKILYPAISLPMKQNLIF